MSPYSYFSLSSKRSEVICARNDKKRVFCDCDVLKDVLKFQFFSVLKIKISCAQACSGIGLTLITIVDMQLVTYQEQCN